MGNTAGDCTWNQGESSCLTTNVQECNSQTEQNTCENAGSCTWIPMVPAQEESCIILTDNTNQETNNAAEDAVNAANEVVTAAQAASDQAARDGDLESAANAQAAANEAIDSVTDLKGAISSGQVTKDKIKETIEKTNAINKKISETVDLNKKELASIKAQLEASKGATEDANQRLEHVSNLLEKEEDPFKTWGPVVVIIIVVALLILGLAYKFRGVEDVTKIIKEASSEVITK